MFRSKAPLSRRGQTMVEQPHSTGVISILLIICLAHPTASGTTNEVDVLREVGLKGGESLPETRRTHGPTGTIDAFTILQDIEATLTSQEWLAVAESFSQGFGLHLNIRPPFNYVGVVVSFNLNTETEFTVALAPNSTVTVFGRHNLVVKLPGLQRVTFLIPEVQEEWVRADLLYRGDMLSLYWNCDLIGRQLLVQRPGPVSGDEDSTVFIADTLTVYNIKIFDDPEVALMDCSEPPIDPGSGSGIIDPMGEKGEKGDTGDQGPLGPRGDAGVPGDRGSTGPAGGKGDQGAKGDNGDLGSKGDSGDKGLKGDLGDIGPPGQNGSKGEKGESGKFCTLRNSSMLNRDLPVCEDIFMGPPGESGTTGPQGLQGVPGEQGVVGEKGDTGRMGNTGKDGRPAEFPSVDDIVTIICEQAEITGNSTLQILCSGQTQGSPGNKGERGFDGSIGPTGPLGSPGLNGTVGGKGDKGDMGDDGMPGIDGSKGDPGIKGEKGLQGLYGVQGLNGSDGVPGVPGEKGIKGEMGLPGQPGQKAEKGSNGTHGPPGVDGLSVKGDKGSLGPLGKVQAIHIAGLSGQKGEPGEKGFQGMSGQNGFQGPPGMKGSKGEMGPMGMGGSIGPRGPLGPPGPPGFGFTGEKGEMGLAGRQGRPGNAIIPIVDILPSQAAMGQMVLLLSGNRHSLNIFTEQGWLEV